MPTKFFFKSIFALAILSTLEILSTGCKETKDDTSSITANHNNKTNTIKTKDSKTDSTSPNKPSHQPEQIAPDASSYFGKSMVASVTDPFKIISKKNGSVVLILIDALNAKHLSAYGYDRQTSPNIDELAKKGMLFTNWISNSSWTRPSFTTIITGLTKNQHGIELTGKNLSKKVKTTAEIFKDAGYKTGAFVGNPLTLKVWDFDQGFDTYEDTKDHRAFPRARILINKAMLWLKKGKDKPFFLMVFLTDPHTPYRPPGDYSKYLKELGTPEYPAYPFKEYKKPLSKTKHNAIIAAYDGEIEYADSQIGRLINELKAMGKYEDTTIIITADHGEAFGNHNCYLHGYHQWESVVRVPFIIKSPTLPSGTINNQPHTHIDILASLLEIAGLSLPAEKLGKSIGQALNNNQSNKDRPIFTQYNSHGIRRQSVRIGSWKLIHHHKVDRKTVYRKLGGLSRKIPRAHPKDLPSIAFDAERYELYNLTDDPNEQINLYTSMVNTAIVVSLKQIIETNKSNNEKKTKIPDLPQETLEALRAAGYIQ